MPAPKLRHYRGQPAAANTWEAVVPAVAAGRALVISKITVTSGQGIGGSSFTFSLRIIPSGGGSGAFANNVTLAPGDYYVEGGLVVQAGEALDALCSLAGQAIVNVFGQEVDD